MTHQLKPITITPEQITAAAQLIINQTDDAWQYTEEQWLAAVENYLRCKVSDILADADWFANKDGFEVETAIKGQTSFVEDAKELNLPQRPEWAQGDIIQRRSIQPEPDGDVLWA